MLWLALIALALFLLVTRGRALHLPTPNPRGATIAALGVLALMALRSGKVSVAVGLGLFAAGLMMFWRMEAEKLQRAAPRQPAPPRGTRMSRREAYAVLGLAPGADAEEIKQAHRRLMKLAHPDAGGSTQRAARLNAARDLLVG